MVREYPSQNRPNHARQRKQGSERAERKRALLKRKDLREDREDADGDPTSPDSGDRAAEDEHLHVGGDTAEQAAELEDEDEGEEDPLRRCDGDELAKGEHETGLGEEV
jgi:hypothetical protein